MIARQKEFLKSVEAEDADSVVDAALMIEVGTYKNYDKVVVVICSPEQQRSRNDPARRQKLNQLVHPAVIARQKEFLKSVEAEDADSVAIVDAALMIEVGTYKNYDKVVVVICSPEQQRSRLEERAGLSDKEIDKRIQSQMPLEEKVQYADFVIDNSGSLEETRLQVVSTYEKLRCLS